MKTRNHRARSRIFLQYAGFFLFLFCLGMMIPSWAEATEPTTRYVDGENGSDVNDGSESSPYQTLEKALSVVDAGDTIQIAGGTYTYDTEYSIEKNLTIQGDTENPVIIQADATTGTANHRVMNISANLTVTLKNLTIRNGKETKGGGIYVDSGSSLTMTNCTVSKNITTTGSGGGIYLKDKNSLTLTNCTISGNATTATTSYGGGIYACDSSAPGTTITVTNCTISGNSAKKRGGGIFITTDEGSASATLTNCTLSGNSAETGDGGGVYNANPMGSSTNNSLTLINCTLKGNTASAGSGGGIYSKNVSAMTNCILWGNTASTNPQIDMPDYTIPTYCVIQGGNSNTFTRTGNLFTDPKLGELANNGGPTQTCALAADSSARDAGLGVGETITGTLTVPTTDQRGISRPQGSAVDIGAYELIPPKTVYVDASASDNNGDGTEGNPYQKLETALEATTTLAGDTIQLAGGTYTCASGYTILKELTLIGSTESPVILQAAENAGEATASVLVLGDTTSSSFTATLKNLTIQNGKTTSNGGGIMLNSGNTLNMTNCTIKNNTASSNNKKGGGIYVDAGATLTLTDCTIADNTAQEGGGIGVVGANTTITLTDCTISGNKTVGTGKSGGGVYQTSGSRLSMTNCTVSGNTATKYGGGICSYNTSDTVTLTNCTISENTAAVPDYADRTSGNNNITPEGGGVYCKSGLTPTLTNCIFWGNAATANPQICAGDSNKNKISYCVIQDGTASAEKHIITGDPKLGTLGDNGGSTQTCALGTGSSALNVGLGVGNYTVASNGTITPADNGRTSNAGTAITVPATDQRGKTRPQGSGVDMGAVEMEITPTAAPAPTSAPAPDPEPTTAPTAAPTAVPTAIPTPAPSGTPAPTISPLPLQGDIQPGVTVTPVPNEEDPAVQELKDELDDPESDARKRVESTIQEEVQKALEEKLGREIDLENMQVNVHTSEAYRFEDVPLNLDNGTGTVIVPVVITYEEPGEEAVEMFFTLVLVYDLSTNPPTPLEYRMVMLEEGDAVSGENRDIAFIRAEDEDEENLVGYLQVRDQSEYDGNPQVGMVSTKYMFLYADGYEGTPAPESPTPTGTASGGGTGGCSLGFFPLALLLALPLVLLKK